MVINDEEDDLGTAEPFKFFLLGMLWTNRPFRNMALFSTMKALWRAVEDVDFVAVDDNRFLFTFFSRVDIDNVLERCPWTFDNHVLLLKEISDSKQLRQGDLHTSLFWIWLYDLPFGAMREDVIGRLARQIGQVLEVKVRGERDGVGRFVRAKVIIDVREPLGRGAMLSVKRKPPVLIQVKYERTSISVLHLWSFGAYLSIL